jgi:glycosyltransferase involved in cell wall biosynthesis
MGTDGADRRTLPNDKKEWKIFLEQKQTLKILQVHNRYQIPGGEDVVAANEKRLLEEHGHQVYTYSRNNSELHAYKGIKKLLIPFTAVFSIKTYREVKSLIKKHDIDVVHVHNTLMMVSPSVFYAAFSCKVPVVQTLHNFRMLCPAGSFFRGDRICEECSEKGLWCSLKYNCYRGSRLQIFVSAAILKVHRVLGTYRRVNFICLTEFNKRKLSQLNRGNKKVVVVEKVYIKPNFTYEEANFESSGQLDYFMFVGRIEALKGIDVAIRAFEGLPDQKLVVAGDGPLMADMKEYVSSHHMKNVEFTGYLSKHELQERYSRAKAVIVCSQCYETFGMTIAEAYSYSVPVIAGDIGNLHDMVEENVTGIRFLYDSPEDLRKKVIQFNQMDIGALKKSAKQFYNKRLRPEDNYRILEQIYFELIQKTQWKG